MGFQKNTTTDFSHDQKIQVLAMFSLLASSLLKLINSCTHFCKRDDMS